MSFKDEKCGDTIDSKWNHKVLNEHYEHCSIRLSVDGLT